MEPIFIYITTKDLEESKQIGSALVKERLVACVNILDSMKSIYWWDDTIHEACECVLIAKSVQSKLEAITQRVKQLHSYQCPLHCGTSGTGRQ